MKIQILSDLHNEIRRNRGLPLDIQPTDADVIVLAGDIDLGTEGVRWAGREARRLRRPVLYVAGNHEFYHQEIDELREQLRAVAHEEGVYFLDNDELLLDGVRFLGSTLWTDYRVWPGLALEEVMASCAGTLPDHHLILRNGKPFSPTDALSLHETAREWLRQRLDDEKGTTVVITHHGPSPACQHPRIPPNPLSAAFQSNLENLLAKADLWIYGHTHACLDRRVAGTRLVSNQLGYPKEGTGEFNPGKVVEVDVRGAD